MTDGADNPDNPVPPVRIGRLNSIRSVRRELARLYVDLRHGKVEPRTAGTGTYVLNGIVKALEVELFEVRLGELEQKAGIAGAPRRYTQVGHA